MTQFDHDKIVPYEDADLGKKEQVAKMFDSIAFRYDFLNRFLSVGIDVYWRKKAISRLKKYQPQQILDVATGTGDVAIMAYKMLKPQHITGIDISEGMLNVGRKKIEELGFSHAITLQCGDSENLPFPDNTFDAITVAFGVRNFENLEKGLAEMYRVLKPGGKLIVLEFSKPKNILVKLLYDLYMNFITPGIGKLISKNRKAYQYLNDSVQAFPQREAFTAIMNDLQYTHVSFSPLTLGICSVYEGMK